MLDQQTLFLICIFGVVAAISFAVSKLFAKGGDNKMRERLSATGTTDSPTTVTQSSSSAAQFKDLFQRVGQAAAKPFMPSDREKQSELRRKLGQAGIYSPQAIRMVQVFKFILLIGGVGGGIGIGIAIDNMMLGVGLGGLAGYLFPTIWLKKHIKKQQRALDYGLPDALDLMVVCVEAGLAVDAAMQRVGQELNIVHPRLSKELEIAHMETRVGLTRTDALKNLGTRTQNAALQGLASMLVQAERFGTSVASALRVHGESLRLHRQHRAEELASKASVKMSFPLVLFIFPATFITLAGPTIVELMKSSLFN
jgi:tight adherence protein C